MKCTVVIDKSREQEIVIYAHENSELVSKIQELAKEQSTQLVGFSEGETVLVDKSEVFCFTVEAGKVFAFCEKEKLKLKSRLYQIEETLSSDFVKINQSCIANINKIARFDTSISGTLKVVFKNGYIDYVSRRQLKQVKERLGL